MNKICRICNIQKSITEFRKRTDSKDGYRSDCKECHSKTNLLYYNTLNGSLNGLFNNAKFGSNRRDLVFELTINDIENLWKNQNGLCYYSKIKMTTNKSNWQVSLERLNQNIGYIVNNVVLCCIEFNNQVQWNHLKIKEMVNLIKNDNNNNKFTPINSCKEKQERKKRNEIECINIRNIINYKCYTCNKFKEFNCFYKNSFTICIECYNIRTTKYKLTIRGSLKRLYDSSVSRTTIRNKNTNNNYQHNITFEDLVDIYNKQNGRCAYSNIKLQFGRYKNTNWICSLERIDSNKGYLKDNIILVCLEFNSIEHNGSYGWTMNKFKKFYDNII
jgi:hypothetical protein